MNPIIDRRVFFKIAATGVTGYFVSPMEMFAQSSKWGPATILGTAKNVIFVLLPGGPSHMDTADLRVGAWTPANFSPTTINGIDWPSGLLPTLGTQLSMNRLSVIRSCQSAALVHSLLQTWNQIARSPTSTTGKIAPNMGSIVAYEFEAQRTAAQKLPGFLSLNGGGTLAGAGYFSGQFSPFDVAPNANGITGLTNGDGEATFTARYNALQSADSILRAKGSPFGVKFEEMADFYSSARKIMYDTTVNNAFKFTAADQTRYGNTGFGNACITAKNVLMASLGVRYIQITLGGWDDHTNIYAANAGIYPSAKALDLGMGTLMDDLANTPGSSGRSMLDETLIVAKGEFGRTVGNITSGGGRDHYFVHSTMIAGGGVIGGRALGSTTADASAIQDPGWSTGRPVYAEDIAATIYSAAGINYTKTLYNDPLQRGFEYIPTTGAYIGQPILELFQ